MGRFNYVSSSSKLDLAEIGSFCSFGPELICGYGEHPTDFVSTNPVFFSTFKQCGTSFADKNYFEERKKIFIGHDVWIGARVFIRDGVKIGNGAIIGAGAVVVKDIPDYAIVGGVPAKIIRFRFSDEIIRELLNINWWNWSEDKLRKAQIYFVKKDIYSFIEWTRQEDFINNLSVSSRV
ncbi:MAG: CatB-related O-acetyltransferase [Nostocaceae cyanobacterium]|nr:CatB-related O-acetyltransferase [Nostocaceae cyanobacterium]